MMFQVAGFEVIDLGTNVSPKKFVETIRSENADLVGMSALLTTTMQSMKTKIEALIQAELRDKVKVNNSQITSDDATIYSDAEFNTYVGASLLDGGAVVPNGGTMTCVCAYNEGFTALDGSCQ